MSSTLLFPLSGNPIGFNHYAAVEVLLRRVPGLERARLVLSNGRHPDPTKPDASVDAPTRLALCEAANAAVADPARSFLARQADLAGDALRLRSERLELSTLELGYDRAVRTAELIPLLRAAADDPQARLHWLAGSDLVRRMADARIFSDADLAVLAANCHYHVLERPGEPVAPTLDALAAQRGVRLHCDVHPTKALPHWLATFLALSSTAIRHAAEAGERLESMLPAPAAAMIRESALYADGTAAVRLVDDAGQSVGRRSALRLTLDGLADALADEARTLADLLRQRAAAGEPHGLAVAETSAGGEITAALAAIPGASTFFRQGRFVYDAHAKTSLLGLRLQGSAVSREAVAALAEAIAREARADYGLAESGMAGPPDPGRRSLKSGLCWLACHGPGGTVTECVELPPFLTRREHQARFARQALALARRVVADSH